MVKHSCGDYKISRKICNLFRQMRNLLVINVLRLKRAKFCTILAFGESKYDKKMDRKDRPLTQIHTPSRKNETAKFLAQPCNPQPQVIKTASLKLPNCRPFILCLFNPKMKPGFVLITQGHMTCDCTAQLCDNASKQQAHRKSMQICFMHAWFKALAVPS